MRQISLMQLICVLIALLLAVIVIVWKIAIGYEVANLLAFVVILDIYKKAVKKTTWTLWISSSLFIFSVIMRYIMALYEYESKALELMSYILTIIPFMYLLGYTFRNKTKKNG